jgi:hypothetical protein
MMNSFLHIIQKVGRSGPERRGPKTDRSAIGPYHTIS